MGEGLFPLLPEGEGPGMRDRGSSKLLQLSFLGSYRAGSGGFRSSTHPTKTGFAAGCRRPSSFLLARPLPIAEFLGADAMLLQQGLKEIGRASCREECRSRWSP